MRNGVRKTTNNLCRFLVEPLRLAAEYCFFFFFGLVYRPVLKVIIVIQLVFSNAVRI